MRLSRSSFLGLLCSVAWLVLAAAEAKASSKTSTGGAERPAATASGDLRLVFTGDNAGEVDQCGCALKPSGGLARRKTAIARAAKEGPVLVLDAGNALFATTAMPDDAERKRAKFILGALSGLGTRAMAAGARDLSAGASFLKEGAQAAKLTVLSANLVDGKGKAVFAPSLIVEEAGKKIAVVGLSPAGALGPKKEGLTGRPPLEALLAEARKLRGQSDIVVALAAVPYADSLQLLGKASGLVDFIIQSHDQRGVMPLQASGSAFLAPGGDRGRQVGVLRLKNLAAAGPFVDEGQLEREKTTLTRLESNIAEVKRRLASIKAPGDKAALQATLQSFERRRAESKKVLAHQAGESGRRKARLEYWTLDEAFPKDPALQAEASKFGPLQAP